LEQGSVLKARIMDAPNIMERLNRALDVTLDPAEKTRILETYSLTGIMTPEQQFRGLLDLATDLRFHFLAVKIAEGWGKRNNKKSYRYHFHQVSTIHTSIQTCSHMNSQISSRAITKASYRTNST
jgi:hypothetical protein